MLLHFGTAAAVKNASLDDLQGAPGVSATVAQKCMIISMLSRKVSI